MPEHPLVTMPPRRQRQERDLVAACQRQLLRIRRRDEARRLDLRQLEIQQDPHLKAK